MALVSSQAAPPSPYDTSMTYPRSSSDLENVRPSSTPAGIPGSRRSSSHGTVGSTYASTGVTSSRSTPTRAVPGRSPSAPPFLEVKARSQSTPATSTLLHGAATTLPPPTPYSRPIRTSSPSQQYTQSAGAAFEAYPPRSSSAAGSHGHPTPQQLQQQQHLYGQQQQQQFQFPSQSSLGFHPDSHQLAHAQYPYQNQAYGQSGYAAGYEGLHQAQQQQHQAMMMQQAQFQQQQWQMEMIRNQQAAAGYEWGPQQGQAQNGSTRRRATSGPAAQAPQPQQYLPYPPSPSPSYSQPGLPPMLAPQFTNGYPTPPGSVEGREQAASTGYHPYRRGNTNSPDLSSKGHQQSSRTTPSMSQQPSRTSSSSMSSVPSSSSHNSASTAPTSRGGDSTTSLSTTEFPPLSKSTAVPVSSSSSAPQQSMRAPPPREGPRPHSPSPSPSFVASRPRTDSQNSTSSSAERTRSSSLKPEESVRAVTHSPSSSISNIATGKKPSPLSQQVASSSRAGTAASTRSAATSTRSATPTLSTPRASMVFADDDEGEDSDDTALGTSTPLAKEKKGIKHKFKKAFSISSSSQNLTLTEAEMDGRGAKDTGRRGRSDSNSSIDTSPAIAVASSSKPPVARRGMFSAKNNASTDNISISSTVSSASVMIRKLGQLGKLARRNSLMSLTKAFKGSSSSKDDEGGDKSSKKDKIKGAPAVANVSHVTAENESSPLPPGISPAAALAKRHQQQYADQEAAAKLTEPPSFAVHARTGSTASDVPSTSSKGKLGWGRAKSTEDLSESASKKGKKWGFGGGRDDNGSISNRNSISLAFSSAGAGQTLEILSPSTVQRHEIFDSQGEELQSPVLSHTDDEYEPSLIGSAPLGPRRDARAVRGILKGAGTYDQEDYAMPRPGFPRQRADSFNTPQQISPQDSHGGMITSGAPQLDGLIHPSPSVSRAESPNSYMSHDSRTNPYSNPNMNKSAPTLRSSTSLRPVRNQSAPGGLGRHIVFAQNLSVHTTWPAEVYDRSAEPATCNRLTPQLAQRIKEELNAYKMEEMEVHPTSRQLTHFFV